MRACCQVCVQICFVRRLLVLLPNFMVIVEHMKFWGNHSFWPSNITDIDRNGWKIMCRWCQDSYIFPRDNIFHQCCALRGNIIPWENITLLAVHQNVIFHDRPGQYLYNATLVQGALLMVWVQAYHHTEFSPYMEKAIAIHQNFSLLTLFPPQHFHHPWPHRNMGKCP